MKISRRLVFASVVVTVAVIRDIIVSLVFDYPGLSESILLGNLEKIAGRQSAIRLPGCRGLCGRVAEPPVL